MEKKKFDWKAFGKAVLKGISGIAAVLTILAFGVTVALLLR